MSRGPACQTRNAVVRLARRNCARIGSNVTRRTECFTSERGIRSEGRATTIRLGPRHRNRHRLARHRNDCGRVALDAGEAWRRPWYFRTWRRRRRRSATVFATSTPLRRRTRWRLRSAVSCCSNVPSRRAWIAAAVRSPCVGPKTWVVYRIVRKAATNSKNNYRNLSMTKERRTRFEFNGFPI